MHSATEKRQAEPVQRRNTPKRIFTCRCGHRLRFGSTTCGNCYHITPFYNRRWPYRILAVIFGAMWLIIMLFSALYLYLKVFNANIGA